MDDYKYANFDGYYFVETFEKYLEEIKNFEVYDSDIWVTSYPKSGKFI